MKRPARPEPKHLDDLYHHYPLFFWKKCSKCEQEFRRERGWKYLYSPTRPFYLCKDCGPSNDVAVDFFSDSNNFMPSMGSRFAPVGQHPSPPPKKPRP